MIEQQLSWKHAFSALEMLRKTAKLVCFRRSISQTAVVGGHTKDSFDEVRIMAHLRTISFDIQMLTR